MTTAQVELVIHGPSVRELVGILQRANEPEAENTPISVPENFAPSPKPLTDSSILLKFHAEANARETVLIFKALLKRIATAWRLGSEQGIELLCSVVRQAVLAWASDVVSDDMRRFALLELR
jgi:hypothetical protein